MWQINAINAATEAACLILSVDETVKNPKVINTCSNFLLLYVLRMCLILFDNCITKLQSESAQGDAAGAMGRGRGGGRGRGMRRG